MSANWKEVGSGEGTLWADSPIGTILPYGGYSAPTGWFICNGAAISRTDYADLFDVIGTSFGSGDGSTTFNLPDLREATTKGVGLTSKSNNHYDSDGVALGEFVEDRIQNITGSLSPANSDCSFDMDMEGTGAISATSGERKSITSTTEFCSWTGFTFDASRVARTGATTEVKAVGVNYIIKAMMVSAPADFMDAVEDAVAEVTPRVWGPGSKADWDELPLEEQVKYDEAHFTDDELTGQIVDAVTDGDMRAVTSNAVADYVQSKLGWTEVSNEISYNSTYVDKVTAYTDGHLFAISIHYLAGTQDQTREVILPNKYLPKLGMLVTLTPFYMNHVDSQQDIVGFINGNKVEFRCYDQISGSSGVFLYGMWGV